MTRSVDIIAVTRSVVAVTIAGAACYFTLRQAGVFPGTEAVIPGADKASEAQKSRFLQRFKKAPKQPILLEVIDFECPGCRGLQPVLTRWRSSNPSITLVPIHLPLTLHPRAKAAAVAAEMARDVGEFDTARSAFLAGTIQLDAPSLSKYLKALGVTENQALRARAIQRVEADRAFARDLGIRGTPTLLAWNGTDLYRVRALGGLDTVFK